MRSMILNRPTSSTSPMSPLWTHPSSSMVFFVASGSIRVRQVYQIFYCMDSWELTLVVSGETVGTSHANLSTWVRFIQHTVPHTREIHQLDLIHRLRPPNGSRRGRVPGERSRARSRVLGHTIPLKEIAHQGYPEEIHNLRTQWCTPVSQHLDPPSNDSSDLIEH